MIQELCRSCPEKTSSGVVFFPGVLEEFPGDLGEKHMAVLESVQAGFRRQKQVGFYPPQMSEEEWQRSVRENTDLAKNNTLVRRSLLGNSLTAVSYRDLLRESSFRGIFDEIAEGLVDVGRTAQSLSLPDHSLIAREVRVLADGFRSGDTDKAMEDYLNLRRHPKYGIWGGFLDRLSDRERALKFDLQAWSTVQKDSLSQDFNTWMRIVLRGMGRYPNSDIMIVDAAGFAGLGAVMEWQANTQPSQPEIGERVGYLLNFFDNVSAYKTNKDVKPKLEQIAPEEVFDRFSRNGLLDRVRRAITAGHEVGHAAHMIPEGADLRLGRWYQVLKEMYSDAFELWSVLKYPEIVISRTQLPSAVYFDLAFDESSIDKRRKEDDITDPYPYAAAAKINTLLNERAITRSSDGKYTISDLNQIREVMDAYLKGLVELTNYASQSELENFILEHSSYPVDFLH
ncbi:MAG: hypothetical protein Q8P92_01470 [Candidatus Daviesbacteria bacterium]|nr:hypothetical protein [Candidatus Daviesbacteria bacterium]